MPAFPRCAALLRNGQPCNRRVAEGSEFCVHHTELLATVDAATLRQGRTPKNRSAAKQMLHLVSEPMFDAEMTVNAKMVTADPAIMRPSLAGAAAEHSG